MNNAGFLSTQSIRENQLDNLSKQIDDLKEKNEQLHSIIKEVREDMKEVRERYNYYGSDNFDLSILSFWIEKLEILDKVDKENK